MTSNRFCSEWRVGEINNGAYPMYSVYRIKNIYKREDQPGNKTTWEFYDNREDAEATAAALNRK